MSSLWNGEIAYWKIFLVHIIITPILFFVSGSYVLASALSSSPNFGAEFVGLSYPLLSIFCGILLFRSLKNINRKFSKALGGTWAMVVVLGGFGLLVLESFDLVLIASM